MFTKIEYDVHSPLTAVTLLIPVLYLQLSQVAIHTHLAIISSAQSTTSMGEYVHEAWMHFPDQTHCNTQQILMPYSLILAIQMK